MAKVNLARLLPKLRANGVIRYRNGDFEIELGYPFNVQTVQPTPTYTPSTANQQSDVVPDMADLVLNSREQRSSTTE
jgi:hypothetical protein